MNRLLSAAALASLAALSAGCCAHSWQSRTDAFAEKIADRVADKMMERMAVSAPQVIVVPAGASTTIVPPPTLHPAR